MDDCQWKIWIAMWSKHMLQVIEHLVDDVDKVSGLCRHLLNVQRDGKPLA